MDRKAWIALTICGILLALNFHYMGKNEEARRIAEAERLEKEEAQNAAEEAANPTKPDSPEATPNTPAEAPAAPAKTVTLTTDTNIFTLSSKGGGIAQNELLKEKAVFGDGNVTMNDLGVLPIGTLTRLSGDSLEKGNYQVTAESADSITFTGQTSNNLTATKTWSRVTEGPGADHRISYSLTLTNNTEAEISLGDVAIFNGSSAPVHADERPNYLNFFWNENGNFDSETHGYFSKMFGADPTEFRQTFTKGTDFAGVENQFFATIVTPKEPYPATYRVVEKSIPTNEARGGDEELNSFHTYLSLRDEAIPAGQSRTFVYDIFMGPKNNSLIRSLEGEKDGVMDYGFFGLISRILNGTLNFFAGLFGKAGWAWGWAIVLTTLCIRTLMWPLHAKSTRTMKRMSKLQPKIAALKEKYPDNPNKMNQEMMKLYREYGVNPMGGCLPMLFQIPVFFGFYNMLQYAVELRNQPFMWVDDLSQPDTITTLAGIPINILPILMAVTMVIQMAITPKTGDKMQQRIFMLMPLVFFFFCYNFASALALYWTTQNIFSIGQTWLMQKMPEPELKTSKKAGKKSFMQKMTERAEEAQKLRQQQQKGGKRPGQKQATQKKRRTPKTGG